jgi:ketosteroid isomerase-like protein
MPSRERVQAFVARVEQDKFVEALQEFYADDAIAQENDDPPRAGLDNLIARERAALARMKIHTVPGSWFLMDGDRVVVHWVFEITGPDGRMLRMDELSHQTWRGDRIVRERFYFDPGFRSRPA